MEDTVAQAQATQRHWWIIEIWKEEREVFKAFIKDGLLFLLLISILAVSHYYLQYVVDYPSHREENLEKVHYYAYLLGLVITLTGFISKLVKFQWRAFKRV